MSCPPQTLPDSCRGGSGHSGWTKTPSGQSSGLGSGGLEVDTQVGPACGETGTRSTFLALAQ